VFSCSPCVLLLQTAVSSSGISVEDHDSPRLETLFPFFSDVFLNLNQRAGRLAPAPGAGLGGASRGARSPARRAEAVAPFSPPGSRQCFLCSSAFAAFSCREVRSFEEGAKNISRKAWKVGDGFVATAVALLFPFRGGWQERVKYHLLVGLEEMPVQVSRRRNNSGDEGNCCGISCQGCR